MAEWVSSDITLLKVTEAVDDTQHRLTVLVTSGAYMHLGLK